MKSKFLVIVYSSVLLVVLLMGCTMPSSDPLTSEEETQKVLKVGVLGPFTGPAESTGDQLKNAVTMAFESVDYTIGDYEVELVWIDSQSDPEIASQAYQQAIDEQGIQVGIINWHSSVAVAVMEVTARNRIPHFFGMAGTDLINQKFHASPGFYGYWNFKGWPGLERITSTYVTVLEDAIADGLWNVEEKRAAVYGEDSDWGRGFGNAIKSHLEASDWTIVSEVYLPMDATDFSATVADYKAQEVGLLVGTATIDTFIANFLKQIEQEELNAIVVADGLGWLNNWHDATGSASNYVLDQIPGWSTEEALAFSETYETRWEREASPSAAGLAYDYSNFFIQIAQATLEQYGELTSETIYQFGQEMVQTGKFSYTGGIMMPEYKYTPETIPDPVVGLGYYTFPVRQYMDGTNPIIWPSEWQETSFQTKP